MMLLHKSLPLAKGSKNIISLIFLFCAFSLCLDIYFLFKLNKQHQHELDDLLASKLSGDAKTIIPHLYQAANHTHLIHLFNQYLKQGVTCLKVTDYEGQIIFPLNASSTAPCLKTIDSYNYIDQKILSISYTYAAPSLKSTLSKNIVTLINMALVQLIFLIIIIKMHLQHISIISDNLRKIMQLEKENLLQSKLSLQAQHLAHDIQSPLSALKMTLQQFHTGPSEQRHIIFSTLSRLDEITNDLLKENNDQSIQKPSNQLIFQSIIRPLNELKIKYKDERKWELLSDFSLLNKSFYSSIPSDQLARLFSNILENAIEALPIRQGRITIYFKHKNEFLDIVIEDNGHGIEKNRLDQILKKGISYKSNGHGLGLFQVHQTLLKFNGKLKIESEPKKGTQVEIQIPLQTPPQWAPFYLSLPLNYQIIIIDDDPIIHQQWNEHFKKMVRIPKVSHFYCPEKALQKIKSLKRTTNRWIVLCDYDFHHVSQNGIDFIIKYQLSGNALLVTDFDNNSIIQRRCENHQIYIWPKDLLRNGLVYFEEERHVFHSKKIIETTTVQKNKIVV